MSAHRSFGLAFLSATATLCLLGIGTPQLASATVAVSAAPAAVDRTGYRAMPNNGASPNAVSPSGCVQYADHPHRSTTIPTRVNGKIRAVCKLSVPKISLSAQLWETRWWGWDRIGINQSVNRSWASYALAMANDWCKKNTVRVTGNGYVIDRDGRSYYASTVSASIKNPCNL
jgi:hypothetical protein